jgi:hypothetical protein
MKNPGYPCNTFCKPKMFFLLIPVIFLHLQLSSQSLDDFTPFGEFTAADEQLKQVPFDKEAGAVIIHHLAKSDYNDQYNMITEHRVKIKILNDKEIGRGNIHISFTSYNDFEFLSGIEAVVKTVEVDGETKIQKLSPKNIYTVKTGTYHSDTRFAIPNVKAGTVFEYKYFVQAKSYTNALDEWYFQDELPTLVIFYKVAVLPITEFAYKVYKLPQFPIEINTKEQGVVSFRMENLPGLKEEAYMDALKDNLQHVTFQLSAFNEGMGKTKYINSWDEVPKELLTSPSFGSQLNKSLPETDAFIKQANTITDPVKKLRAVYDYVQKKMTWSEYYSISAVDGVKSAWEKGTGTNGEINLIFVNLLKSVGMEAIPMLANERQRGKIDINYPFIDQFSQVVTMVKLPGKYLIIDASDKETPFDMVPLSLLNTYAYKVDKKDNGLMIIEDDRMYNENRVIINGYITPDGVLKGSTRIQSFDYARLARKEELKETNHAKFLQEHFISDYQELTADSLVIENEDKDSLPLEQNFVFSQALNNSGDFILMDYQMFTGLHKNPFMDDMRFSDINFGSPQRYSVSMIISLPQNYTIDALPKNSGMRTPDTAFMFQRTIMEQNGILTMQMKLDINRSYFERDEYPTLQAFYKKLFGLLTEQVVLKKK